MVNGQLRIDFENAITRLHAEEIAANELTRLQALNQMPVGQRNPREVQEYAVLVNRYFPNNPNPTAADIDGAVQARQNEVQNRTNVANIERAELDSHLHEFNRRTFFRRAGAAGVAALLGGGFISYFIGQDAEYNSAEAKRERLHELNKRLYDNTLRVTSNPTKTSQAFKTGMLYNIVFEAQDVPDSDPAINKGSVYQIMLKYNDSQLYLQHASQLRVGSEIFINGEVARETGAYLGSNDGRNFVVPGILVSVRNR